MKQIEPIASDFGRILITGGAGSLSKAIINRLRNYHHIQYENIVIYSRDEAKHIIFEGQSDIIRVIGDIRDKEKLDLIVKRHKIDTIIHTAALKRINDLEYYPDECFETNVEGSKNVALVAQENGVKNCILISTDKACKPVNVYGASKFMAERIFSNYAYNSKTTTFGSVRYGNVIASRGSFVPVWFEKMKNNENIPVTSLECTRFLWCLDSAADFVLYSLNEMVNGAIFIPKLDSFTMSGVIEALKNIVGETKSSIETIGLRPGEKIHEDMISEFECRNVLKSLDHAEVIVPDYFGYVTVLQKDSMNSKNFINHDIEYLSNLIKTGLSQA